MIFHHLVNVDDTLIVINVFNQTGFTCLIKSTALFLVSYLGNLKVGSL